MDKGTDLKAIAANLDEQVHLLQTLSLIQELSMRGMTDMGEYSKDEIDSITSFFLVARHEIIKKRFGHFLPEKSMN